MRAMRGASESSGQKEKAPMNATPKQFVCVYRDPSAKCWILMLEEGAGRAQRFPMPLTLDAEPAHAVAHARRCYPNALDVRAIV